MQSQHSNIKQKLLLQSFEKACDKKDFEAAKETLKKAASDCSLSPEQFFSIFNAACVKGQTAIVEFFLTHPEFAQGYKELIQHPQKHDGNGNSHLQVACYHNQLGVAAVLLKHGADPNRQTAEGDTPLMFAIYHKMIVTLLLRQKNIKVDAQKKDTQTALFMACEKGLDDTITALLNAKADPKQIRNDGAFPLYIVIKKQYIPCMETLLKNGADANQSIQLNREDPLKNLLFAGVETNNIEVVRTLLKYGANPNAGEALHMACIKGNKEMVQMLIEYGSNVDLKSSIGETPIFSAVSSDQTEIVKLLLEDYHANPNINIMVENNVSPLLYASSKGYTAIVQSLLKNSADANHADKKNRFPLYMACQNGFLPIVKLLLKHGAQVNQTSSDGITSLDVALDNKRTEIVKLLFEYGADLKCSKQRLQLYLACRNNNEDLILLLLKLGGDVNGSDERGYTPLMAACANSNEKIVHTLIEHGANVNAVANNHLSSLFLACQNGNLSILKKLISHPNFIKNKNISLGIIVASGAGKIEILEFLLKDNSNFIELSMFGALFYAVDAGRFESIRYLLDHPAVKDLIYAFNEEEIKKIFNTLMLTNCKDSTLDIFKILFEFFEPKKIKNIFSDVEHSPLLLAITSGNGEYIKQFLMQHSLEQKEKDYLLQAAIFYRQNEIVTYFNSNLKPNVIFSEANKLEKGYSQQKAASRKLKSKNRKNNSPSQNNFQKPEPSVLDASIFLSSEKIESTNAHAVLKNLGHDRNEFKKIQKQTKKMEEEIELARKKTAPIQKTKRCWGDGLLNTQHHTQIKSVDKAENLFLYGPDYLLDEIENKDLQTEFASCLAYPKKVGPYNQSGVKNINLKDIKFSVKLGDKIYTDCSITCEIKQMHNVARLLCINIPSDSKLPEEQGTLIVPIILDTSGLHTMAETKKLINSLLAKKEKEWAFDITPRTGLNQRLIAH